jgi:tetratricopeptide (TPR) repeat protein
MKIWFVPACALMLFAATSIRDLEKAVKDQPNNAHNQKLLGHLYAQQSGSWKARGPLQKACDLNPQEPDACALLGRALYRLNYFDLALPAWRKATQLQQGRAAALTGLAETLDALGRPREAEAQYRAAMSAAQATAQDTTTSLSWAQFLLRDGRAPEALQVLNATGSTAPKDRRELERLKRMALNAPAATPRAGPSPIRFERSELDMVLRNGATGAHHLPESIAGGVAVLDFDGDGWPDIYCTNGATFPGLRKPDASYSNRLFRNNHDGTFTDVTAKAGVAGEGFSIGVAVGDYDNDGHPDIFVAGLNRNHLFHNRGNGTFEDLATASGIGADTAFTVAAGWFDYDNDGLLDLFVVRYAQWDPSIEPTCSNAGNGLFQYCSPRAFRKTTNLLFHNEGKGRFRNVSKESGIDFHPGYGMSVAFADFDGDGRMDAFVTNDSAPNFLFHNEGKGQFREMGFEAGVALNDDGEAVSGMGTDFRDYDNDGREDIFLTALPGQMFTLYRNLGGKQFANMTQASGVARGSRAWSGWSAGAYDFNNDGFKDLFVAGGHVLENAERNSGSQSRMGNLVFTNKGNGTFDSTILPGDAFHRGAAFADFNRDGKIDVVVTRLNEHPVILRNTSPSPGHWINLVLEGVQSNRDGLGARLHIVIATGEQWNRVTTATGYASSSDKTVHFGLGNNRTIRTIDIDWPSGTKQHLSNVAADRYLPIRESAP